MSNPFERLAARTFATVGRIMGDEATWEPSAGGGPYTTRVLYKDPTNPERIGEAGTGPKEAAFEYFPSDLPGLFESVRAGNAETVTVRGQDLLIVAVEALHDGGTYLAKAAT